MFSVKPVFLTLFVVMFWQANVAWADRHKILVVDDEEGPREATAETLGELFPGTTVVPASGRSEGKSLLLKDPADFGLVVSDLEMGVESGLELAHDVRQTDPTIPFILVSGKVPTDERQRATLLSELKPHGVYAVAPKGVPKIFRQTVIQISLGAGGLLAQIATTGPVHQILLINVDMNLGPQYETAIRALFPGVNVVRVGSPNEAFTILQRNPRLFRLIVSHGSTAETSSDLELAARIQELDNRATFILVAEEVPSLEAQRESLRRSLLKSGVADIVKPGDLSSLQQVLRAAISQSGCGFFISRLK